MKKLLAIPLILVLLIGGSLYWFYVNTKSVSGDKAFKDFLITKGMSASQVGTKLQSAGLVKSALAFKIYLQFVGQAGKIQAGEYRLAPSYSLFQVVEELLKGPRELWVTVPEGLRREEIARKFALALDRDSDFITEFLNASEGKEGRLFPDTYLFPKDVAASLIVDKMTRTFDVKTTNLSSGGSLSFDEKLVLASLIERETKTNAERPVVAGILINRLKIGMPLQVDATLQYAVANSKLKTRNSGLEKWWEPIQRDDLEISSPYNTYKVRGLPPTPIANPGFSSISAAFNPEETEYLYYLHDAKGAIHYAKTLSEHNANVAKYLNK